MTQPFDRFVINSYDVLKFAQDDTSPFRAMEDGVEMGIEYGDPTGGSSRHKSSPYRVGHNGWMYSLQFRMLHSSFVLVISGVPHIGLSITEKAGVISVFRTAEFNALEFATGWSLIYTAGKGFIYGADWFHNAGVSTFPGLAGSYQQYYSYSGIPSNSIYVRNDTLGGTLGSPRFSPSNNAMYSTVFATGKIHKFSMSLVNTPYTGGSIRVAPLSATANGSTYMGKSSTHIFSSKNRLVPTADMFVYDLDLNLVGDANFSTKYVDGSEYSTTSRYFLY